MPVIEGFIGGIVRVLNSVDHVKCNAGAAHKRKEDQGGWHYQFLRECITTIDNVVR